MIKEIRNGLAVRRFHTSPRIQTETNGHHSANVAAIILRIDPECRRELLIAALIHDVAEVYTGDVPAPFKWENPNAKQSLADGEYAYFYKHGIPNPDELLTPEEEQLLKFADMLDLVLSSLEELGRGNRYARQLIENGQRYLTDADYPREWMMAAEVMVREVKEQWLQTTDR